MKLRNKTLGKQPSPAYDLLIRGGRVLDPASGTDAELDIAVSGKRIVRIETGIDPSNAARVVDVTGKVLTPGLIDLHTHIAGCLRKPAKEDLMVMPDVAGVNSGTTTIIDAGSTGAYNAAGFINFVASQAKTRVLAFLNVGTMGLMRVPEVRDANDIDHDAMVAAIKARPDVFYGVKLRMVSPDITELGIDLPLAAKAI
ncbi:MAG: hypothetical protein JRI43_01980, partial [Deltaproteobacteria bacterium]|nr:hypothetical protein [Deltaproteobacteria bacterium]